MNKKDNYIKFNEIGQVVYLHRKGLEEWFKYDRNDNLIHYKNSEGFEKCYRYNDEGKLIHEINNLGKETFYN